MAASSAHDSGHDSGVRCPADLALCGIPCGCGGRNRSHRDAALETAWRALTFLYGGTTPAQYEDPEDRQAWEAMLVAGPALGKPHCEPAPPLPVPLAIWHWLYCRWFD